ncbi:MAG TPA: hypothetical protein VHW23_09105, partial [Kofleriaceae bacterium]|nr:hypothetical protein [Kofleriaceae bacterium]
MGRLVIAKWEVILIVVFGGLCAGMFAYSDDRADRARADPGLDPDEISARLDIPQDQARIAELDQRVTG